MKKIISLQPIDQKDVKRQYRMHDSVKNDSDALLSAVREYLNYELKCEYHQQPNIVRIFTPANSLDYDRLYVEFDSEHTAGYVASFAKNIRKTDRQVSLYVPSHFQSRFQALNKVAMEIRTASGLCPGDVKTKVRYGADDFQLFSKTRNGRWSQVQLDMSKLPPLFPPSSKTSSSPPPGRPREVSPARAKRGASSPLESDNKSHKISSPDRTHPESPRSCSPPYTPSLAAQNDVSVITVMEPNTSAIPTKQSLMVAPSSESPPSNTATPPLNF